MIRKTECFPDRFVQAIIDSDRNKAQEFAFAWMDTRISRPDNSLAFAILDDRYQTIPSGLEEALGNYEIKTVPWMARGRADEILATV